MKSNAIEYDLLLVESFINPDSSGGRRHAASVRPLPGQKYPPGMLVECASELRTKYPAGTVFRLRVTLKQTDHATPHLYSYYGWPFEVVPRKAT